MKSASINDISVEIIGHGRDIDEGGRFNGKNLWLYDKLSELNDDEIVMCVDAFDVIFLTDEHEIKQKFLKMDTPILYGAEKALAGSRYDTPTHRTLLRLSGNHYYKYLNSGVVIGYAKNLVDMFGSILKKYKRLGKWETCSQGWGAKYYASNPKKISLDYMNELIWTDIFYGGETWPATTKSWERHVNKTLGFMENEYFPKNFINGRLRNERTDSFPSVLHIPTNKYMSPVTDFIFENVYCYEKPI
jgi:hypothetical protein